MTSGYRVVITGDRLFIPYRVECGLQGYSEGAGRESVAGGWFGAGW